MVNKHLWKPSKARLTASEKLHSNGLELMTRQQIALIPVPSATKSYMPVSHCGFVEKILAISRDIIRDWVLVDERYIVARRGLQLFGLLSFKKGNPEIGISIAFRNSYDRSISVGISIGASLFPGNILALPCEMTVMRRHTKEIETTLDDAIITTLYKNHRNYEKVIADAKRLKKIMLSDKDAYQLMGLLFGNDIVSPRQLTAMRMEWVKPSRPEFEQKNMWSFLGLTLESLKTSPPIVTMEQHSSVYQFLATYNDPC